MMQYEPHEYCLAFPEMPAEQYRILKESIETQGLLHEITLYEGKILDGRHRYRACSELGIEPTFTTYFGSDALGLVASENSARRHLTASQIAMAGTKLVAIEAERARKRMEATQAKPGEQVGHRLPPSGGSLDHGDAVEIVSKKLGIGENTLRRATNVRKSGVPEVIKAAEDGEITVNEGAKIAQLKPQTQRQVVQLKDQKERQKVISTRLQQSRSKKAVDKNRQSSGDAYVPGTPYVKRFLGRAEQMLNDLVAEAKSENPAELADRFMREMDWSSEPLRMQYQHCEKLFACISRLHSGVSTHRAA